MAVDLSNFSIRRPETIELVLPFHFKQQKIVVSRDQFCESVFNVLGRAAVSVLQCIQRSSSGGSFRVTFKPNKK